VPGPAWAAAEIQRMLTMQAAENRVRSRPPISRRSLGMFPATREGGLDVICEMGALLSDLSPDPRRDYTPNLAGARLLLYACPLSRLSGRNSDVRNDIIGF
jgi:hypothetical protein